MIEEKYDTKFVTSRDISRRNIQSESKPRKNVIGRIFWTYKTGYIPEGLNALLRAWGIGWTTDRWATAEKI